jgi:hypothetical protein
MVNTATTHPDYEPLSFALSCIQNIADSLQEARKRSENMHRMLEIKNSLSGGEVV